MPKPEAPVDELTYFPLPFVPLKSLPSPPASRADIYDPTVVGFHHTVFSDVFDEEQNLGFQAAHDARLQWVWKSQHRAYHRHWAGFDEHFPDTPVKQYRTVIFGLARYIPLQGVAFYDGSPEVVDMRRDEREELRRNGHLIIGRDGVRIRRFLLDYSLQNGFGATNPSMVDELIDLTTAHKRPGRVDVLADILLQQAIDPIVTPGLRQIYAYTKRHEMLKPGLPNALGSLIRKEILAGFTRPRLSRVLASKLTALRAQPAV